MVGWHLGQHFVPFSVDVSLTELTSKFFLFG
jgi:hypothetical protein